MTTPTKPHTGMRVSVAEFLELELPEPDDKLKMELDDGALYIMPRPRLRHQAALVVLTYYFESYFRGFAQPSGQIFLDFVVALPAELPRVFAPDLSIVLRSSEAVVSDRMIEGGPDIVIEILSTDRNRQVYDIRLSQRRGAATGVARRPLRGACPIDRRRYPDHAPAARPGHPPGRRVPTPGATRC